MKHNTGRLHKRSGADLYIETGLFMDHVSYKSGLTIKCVRMETQDVFYFQVLL